MNKENSAPSSLSKVSLIIVSVLFFLILGTLCLEGDEANASGSLSIGFVETSSYWELDWDNLKLNTSVGFYPDRDYIFFDLLGGNPFLKRNSWKFYPLMINRLKLSKMPEVWGGIVGRYFDFQVGGWMSRINLSFVTNTSQLWIAGGGEYSIGNIRFSINFRLPARVWEESQLPVYTDIGSDSNHIFESSSFLNPRIRTGGSFSAIVERSFDFGEESPKLTLGLHSSSNLEEWLPFSQLGKLQWRKIYCRWLINGRGESKAVLSAKSGDVSLGFMVSDSSRYVMFAGWDGDPSLKFQMSKDETLSLSVELKVKLE